MEEFESIVISHFLGNIYDQRKNGTYFSTSRPPICCRSKTAQCVACNAGKSLVQWCKDNPNTNVPGCKGISKGKGKF